MKTLKEQVEVMTAADNGDDVQSFRDDVWSDENPNCYLGGQIAFNWGAYDYRIKPKPLEFWVVLNTQGVSFSVNEDPDKAGASLKTLGSGSIIKVREVVE